MLFRSPGPPESDGTTWPERAVPRPRPPARLIDTRVERRWGAAGCAAEDTLPAARRPAEGYRQAPRAAENRLQVECRPAARWAAEGRRRVGPCIPEMAEGGRRESRLAAQGRQGSLTAARDILLAQLAVAACDLKASPADKLHGQQSFSCKPGYAHATASRKCKPWCIT